MRPSHPYVSIIPMVGRTMRIIVQHIFCNLTAAFCGQWENRHLRQQLCCFHCRQMSAKSTQSACPKQAARRQCLMVSEACMPVQDVLSKMRLMKSTQRPITILRNISGAIMPVGVCLSTLQMSWRPARPQAGHAACACWDTMMRLLFTLKAGKAHQG